MSAVKIDRPPYAHNWARYNFPDLAKMTKALVAFIESSPQITYVAGMPIVRDRIALKLDRQTAIKAARTRGHKASRPYVEKFVEAFFDYDELRNYSGLPSYDQYVAPFQVNRDIQIPVKPLIVIAEGGVLKPVFVVGWATMPLNLFQRRLLMTLLEDAVFSLTDFQNSPGEFISFPHLDGSNTGKRSPLVWNRSDYELLPPAKMKEQVELYLLALAKAKAIVAEKKNQKGADEITSIESPAEAQDEFKFPPGNAK